MMFRIIIIKILQKFHKMKNNGCKNYNNFVKTLNTFLKITLKKKMKMIQFYNYLNNTFTIFFMIFMTKHQKLIYFWKTRMSNEMMLSKIIFLDLKNIINYSYSNIVRFLQMFGQKTYFLFIYDFFKILLIFV